MRSSKSSTSRRWRGAWARCSPAASGGGPRWRGASSPARASSSSTSRSPVSTTVAQYVYGHVAGSSETGSRTWTWTFSKAEAAAGTISAFAGVDPIAVGELQQLIGALKGKGIGVLLTDHNVRDALGICDRAYILSSGSILEEGTPAAIAASARARAVYLGDRFRLDDVSPHPAASEHPRA